jgi:hypothetical protein
MALRGNSPKPDIRYWQWPLVKSVGIRDMIDEYRQDFGTWLFPRQRRIPLLGVAD